MSASLPVKRSANAPSTQLPLSNETLRQELLDAAGFNKERRIAVLKKVIENAESDLEATKQTPVIEHGRVLDVFEQPDFTARSKAREQLIDLIGVTGKQTTSNSGPGKVEIPLAPWMQGLQVTVGQVSTPQPVVVKSDSGIIDVTPQPVVVSNETTTEYTSSGSPRQTPQPIVSDAETGASEPSEKGEKHEKDEKE